MGAFVYTDISHKLATGALDLSTVDVRVRCLMSNTTAGTEEDVTSIAGFTTFDEYDGAGYTILDLASLAATKKDATDRTEIDGANGTFGATVSAGTRSITALQWYVRVDGTDANDYPLAYDDTPPEFPMNGDGGPLNIALDPTGFMHLAA